VYKKGDAGIEPYNQNHTIMTREEGVTVLVFCINELGQPERILIEQ